MRGTRYRPARSHHHHHNHHHLEVQRVDRQFCPEGFESTLKEREAGERSVFPAGSIARTWKVWEPSASCAVVCGELQAANDPESTRHWKSEPASEEEKAKVGVGSLIVPLGPELIVVLGANDSATIRTRWLPESAT
jgi:hypothetical protein